MNDQDEIMGMSGLDKMNMAASIPDVHAKLRQTIPGFDKLSVEEQMQHMHNAINPNATIKGQDLTNQVKEGIAEPEVPFVRGAINSNGGAAEVVPQKRKISNQD
jgi:hypothetical protein